MFNTNVNQVLESLKLTAQYGAKELNLTVIYNNHCSCGHLFTYEDNYESIVDMYATEEELTQALNQIGNVEFIDVDDFSVFAHIIVTREVEIECPRCEEEYFLSVEYGLDQQ